jgi:glutathione S-transferase
MPSCPFCLKLRLFLLEAGLLDKVQIRETSSPEAEATIRDELAPHFQRIGFPTAEVKPGVFLADSDAIIAHFADNAGVNPADLPTFQTYAHGLLRSMLALYAENIELKKRLA